MQSKTISRISQGRTLRILFEQSVYYWHREDIQYQIDEISEDDNRRGQSQEVVKYPIPLVGYPVKTENPTVTFEMPEDNPLYKLKPKKIDWAVWLQASFVYPQYQVLSELKAAD